VLHSLSFVEDPTRILRAIRFEKRFDFQIGPHTERLIKNALTLNMFNRLSGSRIFVELRLIMEEKDPVSCFKRMDKFNILQAIHPLLKLDPPKASILEEVEKVISWYRLLYIEPGPQKWLLYLLALCSGFNTAQTRILCRRLQFSKKVERVFIDLRIAVQEAVGKLFEWSRDRGPPERGLLHPRPAPLEGVLLIMARSQREEMRRAISLYLTQLRNQKIDVSGKDIQSLGLVSGPVYSEILRRITAAKLDGQACDRPAQLELAGELVRALKAEEGE
jgi:tRNA nucleotidyltransferase (CCA-adding enzyme)